MATEVVHIIDPDAGTGYDYDSLYDWEAAEQGDLTGVRDEISVAKCRCTGGTADTTAVTIDGWTTSATQYIKIWTDSAESYRHSGIWSGTKYRLATTSAGSVITFSDSYVRIDGLQISNTRASGSSQDGIYCYNVGDYARITNNLIKAVFSGTAIGKGINIALDSDSALRIINNIIYDFVNGTSTDCRGISATDAGAVGCIYNNTVINCYRGIQYSSSANLLCKNNAVYGSNDAFIGSTTNAANNLSETETFGTNSLTTSQTTAQLFSDYDNDDFHAKAGSDLIGAATNLYNDATYPFQDDIDGDDRGGSGASWDIGADEYVGASAVPKIMLLQDHFSGGIH